MTKAREAFRVVDGQQAGQRVGRRNAGVRFRQDGQRHVALDGVLERVQHRAFPEQRAGRRELADAVGLLIEAPRKHRGQHVHDLPIHGGIVGGEEDGLAAVLDAGLDAIQQGVCRVGHILRHHRNPEHIHVGQLLADAGELLDIRHRGFAGPARLGVHPEHGVVSGGDPRRAVAQHKSRLPVPIKHLKGPRDAGERVFHAAPAEEDSLLRRARRQAALLEKAEDAPIQGLEAARREQRKRGFVNLPDLAVGQHL